MPKNSGQIKHKSAFKTQKCLGFGFQTGLIDPKRYPFI